MNLNALANLSWQEVLIIISIVLAIYIVFTFLRLQGLKHRSQSVAPVETPVSPGAALAAYEQEQNEALGMQKRLDLSEAEKKVSSWYEPPGNPGESEVYRIEALERELVLLKKDRKRLLALEQELIQFRKEVGGLRAEVMVLRESLAKSPRVVSPHYNDAMQMALQGHEADKISQHCDISRAEADLIAALARYQD